MEVQIELQCCMMYAPPMGVDDVALVSTKPH